MNKIILFFLSAIFFFCSCDNKNTFIKGKIVYVDEFKTEKILSGKPLYFIQSKGLFGCEVRKPYLFLNLHSQDDNIAIYNLYTKKFVGNFFKKGKSDKEYISFDLINLYNDSLIWTIDPTNKIIREFSYLSQNDTNAIKQTKTIRCRINDELFCAFPHDSMVYTYKAFSFEDGFFYQNCKTNKKICPYNTILTKNDLNKIMTLAESMKPDGSKIASLTGILDEIDIISLDGNANNNIIITTSNQPTHWEKLKKLKEDELKNYFISIPRSNDEYIVALHDNQSNQEILVFDWFGNGIAKCTIKEKLIDFAVDWTTYTIYGLTEDEIVYQYDTFI